MTYGNDEMRNEFHSLPLDVQLEVVQFEHGMAINGLYLHIAQVKPNLILIAAPEPKESAPVEN